MYWIEAMSKYAGKIVLILLTGSYLSACDLHIEPNLNTHKLQVEEHLAEYSYDLADLTETKLYNIAHQYSRHGKDTLSLTVTYDPRSTKFNARQAKQALRRAENILKKSGVKRLDGDILPVNMPDYRPQVMIAYISQLAKVHEECSLMPGFEDNILNYDDEYKMGCTTQSLIARQVARPGDLIGRGAGTPQTGAARSAGILGAYRSGAPAEELSGETASEN